MRKLSFTISSCSAQFLSILWVCYRKSIVCNGIRALWSWVSLDLKHFSFNSSRFLQICGAPSSRFFNSCLWSCFECFNFFFLDLIAFDSFSSSLQSNLFHSYSISISIWYQIQILHQSMVRHRFRQIYHQIFVIELETHINMIILTFFIVQIMMDFN